MLRRIALGLAAVVAFAGPDGVGAQQPLAARPFAPGERLTYSVSFGPLRVGSGSMELTLGDTIRGRPTYRATYRVGGGTFFYRVDDVIESWFDSATLSSLRFTQRIHEGRYRAERIFDVYPESLLYVQQGDPPRPSVPQPLDDVSFLYFVRTIALEVGASYEFARYFDPTGNPIMIRVLRRDRVTVPAGSFDAIVVQPLIRTPGIFSERGRAEVWLNAAGGHELLQMKSHLTFGSISLYLTGIGKSESAKGATSPIR